MRRFFLGETPVTGGEAHVTGELYRHMARVLRLKPGTAVVMVDDSGLECSGTIGEVGKGFLTVSLMPPSSAQQESSGPRITLYQGMPKGEKLELVLQKATELGVAGIVPFGAARSITRVSGEKWDLRLGRWQRIVREASRQSGRSAIPEVGLAASLDEALAHADQALRIVLWEDEQKMTFREAVAGMTAPESIAVMVGPEGGLSAEEVRRAREHGFVPVSLGKRILRTETAGLAILAIIQFHWGDLG